MATMPNAALLAVLAGALLHASWNAAVKSSPDKWLGMVLVALGGWLIAACALPFLPMPSAASLPFLAASAVLQMIYIGLVAATYRRADMSHAYPLMRGTAPLIVAGASGLLLGEALGLEAWLGIALICASVVGLTWLNHRAGASLVPTAFALGNAAIIASYTLVDGMGARRSGHVVAYTLWLSLLTGPLLIAVAAFRNGRALVAYTRARWWMAAFGGLATIGSYGLALWAMTFAPIAATAALRETSIVFGMIIAAVVLKERVGVGRFVAAVAITLGAAILRLG